jgi:hypothetical protein
MALLATIEGDVYTFAAATSENHVLLDSQGYYLVHNAVDASGSNDLNTVYLSDAPGITASAAAGAKFQLKAGTSIEVPDKWRAVYCKTAAGAPTISVLPKKG